MTKKKTTKQYTDAIKLGMDNIANMVLEYETSGEFTSNEYTKYNLSDAMLIFAHICGSIGAEYSFNRRTQEEGIEASTKFGKSIRQAVLDYTGIDGFKIFK